MNTLMLLAFLGTLVALLIYQLRRERLRSLHDIKASLENPQPSSTSPVSVEIKDLPDLQLTAPAIISVHPQRSPTPVEPRAANHTQVNQVTMKRKKSSRSRKASRVVAPKITTATADHSPTPEFSVLQLLRKRGGLATAMVLHEIFSSPRALRRS